MNCRNTHIIDLPNCLENIYPYLPEYSKCLIITDDIVGKYYLDRLASKTNGLSYVIPHGEDSKELSVVNKIYEFLIENEFDKESLIITLGGGVVGDLGGYVAGTYLRGINWVNIPTTTLSMVDSCVGGKVAVNFNGIKNQIGMFYYPELIIIDEDFLRTLDVKNYNAGLIEALKLGLVADEVLYEYFKQDIFPISDIIERSIKIKTKICSIDERDLGYRHILNFGHTIGHAIESVYHDELRHGECVGYGMIPFIKDEKIKESVIQILKRLGVDYYLNKDKYLKANILDNIKYDKKRNKESINVVEVNFIKDYKIKPMTIEEIKELIK